MTSLLFAALLLAADPTPKEGVLPVGADGKPLNLDFETGTLKDWTAEGDAFTGQPIKGDTVRRPPRRQKSGHQGEYWIGRLREARRQAARDADERAVQGHAAVGQLPRRRRDKSDTCVELIAKPGNEVISRTSGLDDERDMRASR